MAGLHDVHEVLQDPCLKLSQAKGCEVGIAWKGCEYHVKVFTISPFKLRAWSQWAYWCICFGIVYLCKRSLLCVCSLYFLSDILSHLANLSRAFQRKNIDFSLVWPPLVGRNAGIECLKTTLSTHSVTKIKIPRQHFWTKYIFTGHTKFLTRHSKPIVV